MTLKVYNLVILITLFSLYANCADWSDIKSKLNGRMSVDSKQSLLSNFFDTGTKQQKQGLCTGAARIINQGFNEECYVLDPSRLEITDLEGRLVFYRVMISKCPKSVVSNLCLIEYLDLLNQISFAEACEFIRHYKGILLKKKTRFCNFFHNKYADTVFYDRLAEYNEMAFSDDYQLISDACSENNQLFCDAFSSMMLHWYSVDPSLVSDRHFKLANTKCGSSYVMKSLISFKNRKYTDCISTIDSLYVGKTVGDENVELNYALFRLRALSYSVLLEETNNDRESKKMVESCIKPYSVSYAVELLNENVEKIIRSCILQAAKNSKNLKDLLSKYGKQLEKQKSGIIIGLYRMFETANVSPESFKVLKEFLHEDLKTSVDELAIDSASESGAKSAFPQFHLSPIQNFADIDHVVASYDAKLKEAASSINYSKDKFIEVIRINADGIELASLFVQGDSVSRILKKLESRFLKSKNFQRELLHVLNGLEAAVNDDSKVDFSALKPLFHEWKVNELSSYQGYGQHLEVMLNLLAKEWNNDDEVAYSEANIQEALINIRKEEQERSGSLIQSYESLGSWFFIVAAWRIAENINVEKEQLKAFTKSTIAYKYFVERGFYYPILTHLKVLKRLFNSIDKSVDPQFFSFVFRSILKTVHDLQNIWEATGNLKIGDSLKANILYSVLEISQLVPFHALSYIMHFERELNDPDLVVHKLRIYTVVIELLKNNGFNTHYKTFVASALPKYAEIIQPPVRYLWQNHLENGNLGPEKARISYDMALQRLLLQDSMNLLKAQEKLKDYIVSLKYIFKVTEKRPCVAVAVTQFINSHLADKHIWKRKLLQVFEDNQIVNDHVKIEKTEIVQKSEPSHVDFTNGIPLKSKKAAKANTIQEVAERFHNLDIQKPTKVLEPLDKAYDIYFSDKALKSVPDDSVLGMIKRLEVASIKDCTLLTSMDYQDHLVYRLRWIGKNLRHRIIFYIQNKSLYIVAVTQRKMNYREAFQQVHNWISIRDVLLEYAA